jgi:catechol 2,3-dioxygenase-like lactoylglutathione lyase family enzyme
MFKDAKPFVSFSVDDTKVARKFYGETLGLDVSEDPYMPDLLNIRLNSGSLIMVYPKPDHEAATYTVLNFMVPDIEKAVDQLTDKGVKFESYDNEYMKTDEKGIAKGGPGPAIAWFRDPAGNILSVLEEKK